MIACSTVAKRDIQLHYDLATVFYRILWGRHIHHGLWEGTESPSQAQQNLVDTLARLANIAAGDRVVDVGCGMGGSSLYLAMLGAHVTGITLSPVQRCWAAAAARWRGLADRATFRRADAESIELPAASFDVVWSVECTEHLFDKPLFFRRAADWVRPGGRLAICAWLAGDAPHSPTVVQKVHDVCEGFLCPSLGTEDEYRSWITAAGFRLEHVHDWTARVSDTWRICLQRVRRSRVRWLARLAHRGSVDFLDRFDVILDAYQSGAMKYGCFIARR